MWWLVSGARTRKGEKNICYSKKSWMEKNRWYETTKQINIMNKHFAPFFYRRPRKYQTTRKKNRSSGIVKMAGEKNEKNFSCCKFFCFKFKLVENFSPFVDNPLEHSGQIDPACIRGVNWTGFFDNKNNRKIFTCNYS